MNAYWKVRFLVSGLLLGIMFLSTLNLLSCGGNIAPTITSITPNSTDIAISSRTLPVNTGITISGSHFGTSQGSQGQVYFDNIAGGAATSWTDNTIVLPSIPTVPGAIAITTAGTAYTAIVYVTANGQGSNIVSFVYNGT